MKKIGLTLFTFALLICFLIFPSDTAVLADDGADTLVCNNATFRIIDKATSNKKGNLELVSYNKKNKKQSVDFDTLVKDSQGLEYHIIAIGDYAFVNSKITFISLPNTITSIGTGAFANCKYLEDVDLPEACNSINDAAFFGCEKLINVELPASVKYIGQGCFSYCNSIANLHIDEQNETYTSIDDVIYTKNLKHLVSGAAAPIYFDVSDKVKVIDAYAFEGNKRIKSIYLPLNDYKIETGAFMDCQALEELELGGVTSIGSAAFYACESLTYVDFPACLVSITDNPFAYCNKLDMVRVDESNTKYQAVNNCILTKSGNTLISGSAVKGKYIVPETIKHIAISAFEGNTRLTEIILSSTLKDIKASAFRDCSRLERVKFKSLEVKLPSGASKKAFDNTYSILSVNIPYSSDKKVLDNYIQLIKNNSPKGTVFTYSTK